MSGRRVGVLGAAKLAAPGRFDLVLRGSDCWSVFVDEPSAGCSAPDLLVEFDHGRVGVVGGCSLAEASMGPMSVVVGHELFEEPAQLVLVPDQGPIE